MARNGSGTYNVTYTFADGNILTAAQLNSMWSDIGTALTGSLAKDGQTVPSANLPMGNYRHTGVGNGSARTDYAAVGQVQDSAFLWGGTAGGTADALTLTPSPAITAYAAGQVFRFKSGASPNTSTVTLAVSGLTTKAIQKNGSALAAGDIVADTWYEALYDGSAFQLSTLSLIANISDFARTVLDDASAAAAQATLKVGVQGASVASATSTDIWAGGDGDSLHITGTTTITGFGTAPQAGAWRLVTFDDVLTLTYGASTIVTPSLGNLTTAAGNVFLIYADTTSKAIVLPLGKAGVTALGAQATIDGSTDYVPFWDASAGALAKALVNDLQKGLRLESAQTASSSASLDWSGLAGGNGVYLLTWLNHRPASDGGLLSIRMGSGGGPTWDTGANYSFTTNLTGFTASPTWSAGGAASGATYMPIGSAQDAGSDASSGAALIFSSAANTYVIALSGNLNTAASLRYGVLSFGHWTGTNATGVRVLDSTGNIAQGTFQLHRLRIS